MWRDLGEFLLQPKCLKKHVLHRFVLPDLQGGINEGVDTVRLANARPLCEVKGRDRGEFLLLLKLFKKQVLQRFVHPSP